MQFHSLWPLFAFAKTLTEFISNIFGNNAITIIELLAGFCVALLAALLMTPGVIKLSRRIGAIDQPDERKSHSIPTPRLGGTAVFLSLCLGLTALLLFDNPLIMSSWLAGTQGLALAIACTLMFILGAWDDLKTLGPARKFGIQICLGTLVYFAGFKISGITHPFTLGLLPLGAFEYVVTLLWIIGVTNAVNLIDGLDGLAPGVSVIAASTMIPIAFINGDAASAVVLMVLAGSILGFMRYNISPAKIFMGDSGSLVLGFLLAVLSVKSSTKGTTVFALIVPVLALGLPIMDTLLAMIRRLLGSFVGDKKQTAPLRIKAVFRPDRGHIHHKLVANGFSSQRAVLVLYAVSCLLGLCAFAVTVANNVVASTILVVLGIACFVGVRKLNYREMAVFKNGMLLPLYDSPALNKDSIRIFFDLGFILFSSALSLALTVQGNLLAEDGRDFIFVLAILVGIKLVVFAVSGIYRRGSIEIGITDALRLIKIVGVSVLATSVISFSFFNPGTVNLAGWLLEFYFLVTFVLGSRMSFQVLKRLAKPEIKDRKRIAIYGANHQGAYLVDQVSDGNLKGAEIVGFFDENPAMEGRDFEGNKIFGGHWKISSIHKKSPFDELLITDEHIFPEVFKRLKLESRRLGFSIKNIEVNFTDSTSETLRTSNLQHMHQEPQLSNINS